MRRSRVRGLHSRPVDLPPVRPLVDGTDDGRAPPDEPRGRAVRRGELDCEPPDPAWVEEEAARRRAAWEAERPQRRLAKRAERERQSLSRRVLALETELALSASMSAARISGGGGGGV